MGLRHRASALGRKALDQVGPGSRRGAVRAIDDGSESQLVQRLLAQTWREAARRGDRPSFADVGFSVFSQNDEDGILVYLMAVAGTTNRVVVELAFGEPLGAHATNLLVNWGWAGYLIEGDERQAEQATRFFARNRHTAQNQPTVICAYVDPASINDLFRAHGLVGEIDVFSLDLDGFDWWIWDALDVVTARCVVVEFMHWWGPARSVTVPSDPSFSRARDLDRTYCSASLEAYVRLARRKGYRLVGTNNRRYNAFFLRDDVATDLIPAVTPDECFADPPNPAGQPTWAIEGLPGRWIEVLEDGTPAP